MTEPATVREGSSTTPTPTRRSLLSRLSIGHVVMILAGLVAILLNLALLRSGTDTVRVAVAASTLQAGSPLGDDTIDTIEIGDAGALADGLLTEETVVGLYGSVLARGLSVGEPIRRSDLRPAGTAEGLREMSVELEAKDAAGGLIENADLVDIIGTIGSQSFYVADGVEVALVTREDSGFAPGDDLIIVLNVDDRTALEIASAQAAGSIILVRSTGATPPVSGPLSVDPLDQP